MKTSQTSEQKEELKEKKACSQIGLSFVPQKQSLQAQEKQEKKAVMAELAQVGALETTIQLVLPASKTALQWLSIHTESTRRPSAPWPVIALCTSTAFCWVGSVSLLRSRKCAASARRIASSG